MKNNKFPKGKKKILAILFVILFTFNMMPSFEIKAATSDMRVIYTTHIQNIGWLDWVKNGATSGTSGKSLRMEGIKIGIKNNANLGIRYSCHVQDIGWQDWVKNGALGGTSGQSKRIEALKIELTGSDAANYDVYYRALAQDFGWLGWAKDGDIAGTAGLSKRLEAIQIKVLPKGDTSITTSSDCYAFAAPNVSYTCHVQNVGWQSYVSNGNQSGTTGRGLRLEGIKVRLSNMGVSGGISYSTQIQNIGWQNFMSDDQISGTTGRSLRLESIKIKLTGDVANYFDVYYRVHSQNYGWLGWAKNGDISGTVGLGLRLEGIQIVIVRKGSGAPGAVSSSYIYKQSSNCIVRNDNTRIINNKIYIDGVSSSIPLKYNTAYTYLDNVEDEILATINNYRASKGFSALTSNSELKTIARYKATGMMEYNKVGNAATFMMDVANERDGTDGCMIHKMGINFDKYKYNISNTSVAFSTTSMSSIMRSLEQNWMLDFKRMENVGIAVCQGRGGYYISVYYSGKMMC